MAAAVELHDLTVAYRRHVAVAGLSGCFVAGSLTALVGPNGAGKSTLLKAIVGMVRPHAGRIGLTGIRRADIAYLPQISDLDRSFPISVLDLVSLGAWRRTGPFRRVGRADLARVEAAIAEVGLAGLEDRVIGTLSGGQLQRALFARLLLQDAGLLLLDEPFTAIDLRTQADLLRLIASWHREGRTVIAALHDIDIVREHFPQTLLLAREPVAWGDTTHVLTSANLVAARELSDAFDAPALPERRAA